MSEFSQHQSTIEPEVEARLRDLDPALELIALERPANETLRLYIDHPEGVGLDRCERVTAHLRDLLSDYSLEVSSPGLDRPLTKPEHFQRFLGHDVRLRTSESIGGQRNFTGRLEAAGPESITLDPGGEIPLDRVSRANLVPELPEVNAA